jgi:histidine ammonia-lyase
MARRQAFDVRIHQLRNHQGQLDIAQQLQKILAGSDLFGMEAGKLAEALQSSASVVPPSSLPAVGEFCAGKAMKFSSTFYKALPTEDETPRWLRWETLANLAERKINPQDAYSIRCTAQVLGASAFAIEHLAQVMAGELNAVTDNPLLFEETEQVLSGGNFHGQPLALPLDYLKIALAEIGSLLERQVNKLTDANHNDCLPPFLVENAGLNSGFMIPQYTCASLVSENKVLAHPASVDSIPTSANQEDHVSMGSISARQAIEVLGNVKKILSIHVLNACQARDLREKQLQHWGIPYKTAEGTNALYQAIRQAVPYLSEDRLLYKDIEKAHAVLEKF